MAIFSVAVSGVLISALAFLVVTPPPSLVSGAHRVMSRRRGIGHRLWYNRCFDRGWRFDARGRGNLGHNYGSGLFGRRGVCHAVS